MATVPSPRTWAVGELLTAAKLNTDLRDGLNFLLTPPRALLHKSANQSINLTTWTAVTWDSEQYDSDGGHSDSTNNSRYTVQTAGWWEFHARIMFNTAAGGDRGARFLKNGAGNPFGEHASGSSTSVNDAGTHGWALLSVGDYIETQAYQGASGSLSVAATFDSSPTFMTAKWIGKN